MKRTIKISVIILALVVLLTAVAVTMAACNENKEQSVPKDDHSNSDTPIQPPNKEEHVHEYTLVAAKSPTCTEDGNVQYYTCTCGKYFDNNKNEILLAATVLPAKGHDKVTSSWESDTTSHWHKCNNCDEKLDLQAHTKASVWTNDSDATCTAKAHHHKECSACKYVMEEEDYGDMLPHALGEWTDDSKATCTAKAHHHRNCVNCDYAEEEDYGEMLPHEMSDWIIDEKSNCGDIVSAHKDCANCDYRQVDENYVMPHTWNEQGKCDICGKEKPYKEHEAKIYFGEYPQTKETDNGIIATLAQMSGNKPYKGNRGKWTDYGYYIEGNRSEYMWYIDLEYGGYRYRGVYFTSYRPYYTPMYSSSDKTYQDDNGYYTNTLYWFKWEPIEWRVLETTSSEVFVMSNLIIDAQHYYINIDNRTMNGQTVYPNNYKESDIRAWLNGTFYNWAFDSQEKLNIKTTLVDNSAATTAADSNQYICENTNDKVFLLSYKDVINEEYGFDPDAKNQDKARLLDITDYALSQGSGTAPEYGYNDNNMWWLRSPDTNYFSPEAVNFDGTVNMLLLPYIVSNGVVPAIKIALL